MIDRAFVAVVPPGEALDAVGQLLERLELPIGVRPTTRDQWHVTLQFLGRVDDVDAVGAALDDAIAVLPPVPARFGGGSALPQPRRGTVLVLGLDEGADALRIVAAAVGGALRPHGHPPEDRRFQPHLTLARCKSAQNLEPLVAAIGAGPVGPRWLACDVVLFESHTLPTGAVHEERARFALCG